MSLVATRVPHLKAHTQNEYKSLKSTEISTTKKLKEYGRKKSREGIRVTIFFSVRSPCKSSALATTDLVVDSGK